MDDQKEEELRVIASAFHELAMKNFDLEKKLASSSSQEQKVKNANTSPASGAFMSKVSAKNNLSK